MSHKIYKQIFKILIKTISEYKSNSWNCLQYVTWICTQNSFLKCLRFRLYLISVELDWHILKKQIIPLFPQNYFSLIWIFQMLCTFNRAANNWHEITSSEFNKKWLLYSPIFHALTQFHGNHSVWTLACLSFFISFSQIKSNFWNNVRTNECKNPNCKLENYVIIFKSSVEWCALLSIHFICAAYFMIAMLICIRIGFYITEKFS